MNAAPPSKTLDLAQRRGRLAGYPAPRGERVRVRDLGPRLVAVGRAAARAARQPPSG